MYNLHDQDECSIASIVCVERFIVTDSALGLVSHTHVRVYTWKVLFALDQVGYLEVSLSDLHKMVDSSDIMFPCLK